MCDVLKFAIAPECKYCHCISFHLSGEEGIQPEHALQKLGQNIASDPGKDSWVGWRFYQQQHIITALDCMNSITEVH